jgi:hypothetical protein
MLRDQFEALHMRGSVDAEVFMNEGEYRFDLSRFTRSNQSCIRKIHGKVLALAHERPAPFHTNAFRIGNLHPASCLKFPQVILSLPKEAQKVEGFGKDSSYSQEQTVQIFEDLKAGPMVVI